MTQIKVYSENGTTYKIKVSYGWRVIQEQEPYFFITASIDRKATNGKWVEDSCGCLHDDIVKHFPELKPLIKWHLCNKDSGPTHYEANAKYWFDMAHGLGKWPKSDGDPDPMKAFKTTVVFGALCTDTVPTPETLETWLADRKPALMTAFHHDMQAFNIDNKEGA